MLHEYLKPHKYPLVLKSPLPKPRYVRRIQRMENRGLKVIYRKPLWVLKQEKEKKEGPKFEYPAKREFGSGLNVVRKRKPFLFK